MAFWLVKSEPSTYSIDNLKKDQITRWDSIRNYQARNFLKQMNMGDSVLFYHSSSEPSGVAGLARVAKTAYPDPTQFDKKSDYYDPKASAAAPRWFSPDLRFVKKFSHFVSIAELRKTGALKNMELLQRGSRLSVQALTEKEFETILSLAGE
jgi:predicted RNA-binding protein with PUA-like domain